jgi:hypothetical protein
MLSRSRLQTPPRSWKIAVLSQFKGETDVSKTVRIIQILAVILGLALAIPAMADTLSKSIVLHNPAKLGGTELKAGDYWLVFDGAKLTLKQGKKVVAEAKAKWVEVKTASQGDAIIVDNGAISEIRMGGRKRVIKIL